MAKRKLIAAAGAVVTAVAATLLIRLVTPGLSTEATLVIAFGSYIMSMVMALWDLVDETRSK